MKNDTKMDRADKNTVTERQQAQSLQGGKEQIAVPVIEEQMAVGKRAVEGGGVKVTTKMVEKPVNEQLNLREEHVRVERRPVDRPATAADMNALRGGTMELTERSEEAVVSKTARVVEEILVTKDVELRTERISGSVKHTEVNVEKLPNMRRASGFKAYDSYDTYFRDDFRNGHYGDANLRYEDMQPAYRYGYDLGTMDRFQGKDWSAFEGEARTRWEERNPGTWEQVKMAVRNAWTKATGH